MEQVIAQGIDSVALDSALRAQGEEWYALVRENCPHLFSDYYVVLAECHFQQMQSVVAAVEQALGRDETDVSQGVFYGYDFHLSEQGAKLIEINTNAGGAFLNALLLVSQQDAKLKGYAISDADVMQQFIAMFEQEWRLSGQTLPLKTIAIVDETPTSQYLYPEFLLAQRVLEQAGYQVFVVAPDELVFQSSGLYYQGKRVQLVYNRLVDFALGQYVHLANVWQAGQIVLTPNPNHYVRYADKRHLINLSDERYLQSQAVADEVIAILQRGIPKTVSLTVQTAEAWWSQRKAWFFKPSSGYGSKGVYRGDKMTKRVFADIMASDDYIAQQLAPPGELQFEHLDGVLASMKYDVRCYVYMGKIQLVVARLYQGQTTNFRTEGGGFALVRLQEVG